MDYKDYRNVLGVSKDAEEKRIKRACHRLACALSPGKNPKSKPAEEYRQMMGQDANLGLGVRQRASLNVRHMAGMIPKEVRKGTKGIP